jgi:hypothetical protein
LSLSSLDVTRAGEHQRNLSLEVKDEDVARAAHHLGMKTGKRDAYAPGNGLSVPVPRFKDDLVALIRLTNLPIPPLRVVRSSQVVHVFYGFGLGSSSARPFPGTTIAGSSLQKGSRHPAVFDAVLGFGQPRRRKRA